MTFFKASSFLVILAVFNVLVVAENPRLQECKDGCTQQHGQGSKEYQDCIAECVKKHA